jgi:hypothetical protein
MITSSSSSSKALNAQSHYSNFDGAGDLPLPRPAPSGGALGPPGSAGLAQLREEKRRLQKDLEVAHKELDRRDSRNDKLTKELLETRAAYASHDRELKKLSGNIKRIYDDKQAIVLVNAKLKESLTKAEDQLLRYSDAEAMILSVRANKEEVERCRTEINRLIALLDTKEEKIKQVTYENDVLRRSIDIQLQFESGMKGLQNGREITRSLCSELAKKQTGRYIVCM